MLSATVAGRVGRAETSTTLHASSTRGSASSIEAPTHCGGNGGADTAASAELVALGAAVAGTPIGSPAGVWCRGAGADADAAGVN